MLTDPPEVLLVPLNSAPKFEACVTVPVPVPSVVMSASITYPVLDARSVGVLSVEDPGAAMSTPAVVECSAPRLEFPFTPFTHAIQPAAAFVAKVVVLAVDEVTEEVDKVPSGIVVPLSVIEKVSGTVAVTEIWSSEIVETA